MNRYLVTLFAASIAYSASPAAAQLPRCERGVPAVDLGVTYAASSDGDEPRVDVVDPKGPGVNRLQKGDFISRVNGYPIGTPQAMAALREGRPGSALVLTVRRASKLVPVSVTPSRIHCSTLVALQPTRVPLTAAGASGRSGAGVARPTTSSAPTSGRIAATSAGWLGMGFACSECEQHVTPAGVTWHFREYPTIWNVDPGSPAYAAGIRRGDVLVRVEGQDVRTAVAGSRLGQVKPGESLRLSYRRANRTSDATLRVARSPAATATLDRVEAENLLRSTQDLRVSEMESELRRLYTAMEKSAVEQRALSRQLENTLAREDSRNSTTARAMVNRLQRMQDESQQAQQRTFEAALRAGQEDAKRLGVVQQRLYEVTQGVELAETRVAGSAAATYAPSRTDRLRFSGSIGDADVEVRGPGSVNVQRMGDDLVVVTGDAVITITQRKPRQGGNQP